jgi:hypothetical protein
MGRRLNCELFLLAITAIGLGIGYATYLFGLSFAFGAFQAGVSVVSLMRNGALQLNPDAANRFSAGDWVAVIGTAEQITAFQGMIDPMSP